MERFSPVGVEGRYCDDRYRRTTELYVEYSERRTPFYPFRVSGKNSHTYILIVKSE